MDGIDYVFFPLAYRPGSIAPLGLSPPLVYLPPPKLYWIYLPPALLPLLLLHRIYVRYNPNFIAQVNAMENRAAALGMAQELSYLFPQV